MAVAQRGSATTALAVGTGSAVVSKPTGVVAGDLLVAKCTSYDTAGQTVTSSGWTALGSVVPGGASSTSLHVLYKVAGSSEPATWTFTEGTAYYLTVELTAWSGADTASAPTIGTFATGNSSSGAGAKTFSGVTMPAAGQLLALVSGYAAGWSTPSGFTALVSNFDSVNSTYGKSVASGSTGNVSVSTTGTTSYAGVLVGIVEVSGSTPVSSSDTGSGAEGTPSIRLTGAESAAGTDAGSVAASMAGTETASGSESSSIATSSTDAGTATDATTLTVAVGSSETASGSESSSIATSSTDAGTATDATTLTVAVGSSDTASGADAESVGGSSAPTSSDPATGTDAGTVTASTPASDTATGTDAGSVVAATTTGEVAAGADGATVLVLVASLDVATAVDAGSVANDADIEPGSVVLSVAAATAVLSAAAASVVLSVVAASATLTATGD